MSEKVVVTGGAGFIGSNFISYYLLKHPEDISSLSSVINNPQFSFYKVDICDRNQVEKVFEKEKPSIVINFAAESHVDRSIDNPEVFLNTILGVYYAGGEVSDKTMEMVYAMTDGSPEEYEYEPTWSWQKWPYNMNVKMTEFITAYIDTFIRNPLIMTRAVLARNNVIWDIFKDNDMRLGCVRYTSTNDGYERNGEKWNDYYPERTPTGITSSVDQLLDKTVTTQWVCTLTWRSGFYVLLRILSFTYLILSGGLKKEYFILMIPAVGQVIGLLLSTGWADFRYYWPLNLLNLSYFVMSLVINRKEIISVNE